MIKVDDPTRGAREAYDARRRENLSRIKVMLSGGYLTTAESLASTLKCSERTIYRYMALLKAEGLPVRGESGVGYQMRKLAREDVEAQFEVE